MASFRAYNGNAKSNFVKKIFLNYKYFLNSQKMKNKLYFLLIIILIGCEEPNKPSEDDIIFPTSKISYAKYVQPLFNQNCTKSGCHEPFTRASNLDLTSYNSLRLRFNDVIVPKDTALSRIVWRIEARSGFLPMPPTKKLTSNQIIGIKTWIMEGATDTIR